MMKARKSILAVVYNLRGFGKNCRQVVVCGQHLDKVLLSLSLLWRIRWHKKQVA